MSDPLSDAVEAAVARAIVAHLPTIIEAIRDAALPPSTEPDRFIKIAEAAKMLGHSESSLKRHQRLGSLPRSEKIGGRCGYRASTVQAILDGINKPQKQKRGRSA